MSNSSSDEQGITPLVNTFFSHYSLLNIIEIICEKKIHSILTWLGEKKIKPKKCLIIGSYLTGIRLANYLCATCTVTVLDIYPHLQGLLHPQVTFARTDGLTFSQYYDVIIDTSGLGGINPNEIIRYKPPVAFIVEDPCSDGSDECTRMYNHSEKLIHTLPASHRGKLWTSGLFTKTSGTMTLTMEVVRNSMHEALCEEGVLYSSSHLDFYERIIFKEKNIEKFLDKLVRPALVVSSLKPIDTNRIIKRNLEKINSRMHDVNIQ